MRPQLQRESKLALPEHTTNRPRNTSQWPTPQCGPVGTSSLTLTVAIFLLKICRGLRKTECNGESLSGPRSELERYSMWHIGLDFSYPCFVRDTVHTLPELPAVLEQVFCHLWNLVSSVMHAVRSRCTIANASMDHTLLLFLSVHLGVVFAFPPRQNFATHTFSHVRNSPWQDLSPVNWKSPNWRFVPQDIGQSRLARGL